LDLLAPITIREPNKRTLIQGGKLLVTGLARPGIQDTLVARLVTARGEQVGMRVGAVESLQPGSHGEFAMEVPYQISSPTKVLLTVTASTDDLTDIIYLSSVEIILSP
jgi:hypothetical protein